MRSNSPKFQLLPNQIYNKQSPEYVESVARLTFAPLTPDGEEDSSFQCCSRSNSPTKSHNDENPSIDNKRKEAIEVPLTQKVLATGDDYRRWVDLTWATSWILMLNRELNGSFVFGVLVVYGFGQGVGGAINTVVVDYYWKDVELAQPSAVQLYRGLSAIPWDVKPLWGLMTDILPMAGYRRRPYFLITGVLTIVGTVVLVTGGKLWVPMAVGMLVLLAACGALSDATIDAEVARKSREKPSLAADVQILCAIALSVGSLVGFAFSGLSVDKLGSKGALGLMLIPAFLLVVLGFVLLEERDLKKFLPSQLGQQLRAVTEQLWSTLKQARVWKPTLYMYLSLALNPDISEGKFYWYTSGRNGPAFSEMPTMSAAWSLGYNGDRAFDYECLHSMLDNLTWISTSLAHSLCLVGMDDYVSMKIYNIFLNGWSVHSCTQEFVGFIYATGSIGTIAAVYFYHKKLKKVSFRWILFWVQFLIAVFGILDYILVTRFNNILHIPDHVFVIGDEGMTKALSRLKWMPLLILAAKLCPPGIEGTFFSFLMSVDNVGMLTSSWLGAALLGITKVTRDNFKYLWLAVTIRNILRLIPLLLVFLLPNTHPEEEILAPIQREENIQLVVTTFPQKESSLGIQRLS